MTLLKRLLSKLEVFLKSVRLYPVELCMAVFLFLSAVAMVEAQARSVDSRTLKPYLDFFVPIWVLCPFPLILTITIRRDWRDKAKSLASKMAYWASGLFVLLPGLVFSRDELGFEILCTYLLSFLLLVSCGFCWDNKRYAYNASRVCFQALTSAVVSGVFALAYYAIASSVNYLFFQSGADGSLIVRCLIAHGGLFILTFFFPLFFTHSVSAVSGQRDEAIARLLGVCCTYVLYPFLLIYTLILYAYSIKILVLWDLPKGMVGWMVMGYIFLAFVGRMAQDVVESKRFGFFFRNMPLISIVPLTLFWVGVCRRLSDYGLTEFRVYILAFGILATLFMLFLVFRQTRHYLLMAGMVSAVVVVLTFIPCTKASRLAISSQWSVVNDYVEKYDLLAADGKRLKDYKEWGTEAMADSAEVSRFITAYLYLGQSNVKAKANGFIEYHTDYVYGRLPSGAIRKYRVNVDSYYFDSDDSGYKWYHHDRKHRPFDVKDYRFFCGRQSLIDFPCDQNMRIFEGGKQVASIDMGAYFKANADILVMDSIPLEMEEQVFSVKNDSLLILLEDIGVSKGAAEFLDFSALNVMIFSKCNMNIDRIKTADGKDNGDADVVCVDEVVDDDTHAEADSVVRKP